MKDRTYIAIDLKSFFASVECVERGLNPLNVNLVVADEGRTSKTICLAVSPSLKAYGIAGRARLFEVIQRVREVNAERRKKAYHRTFSGKSVYADELKSNPSLELDYIIAPPQMAHYMKTSAAIYNVYLKYIAPEDIHVYSIDEVFIDATKYLKTYEVTAKELAAKMILDVLHTTGITATAGIGTNMYLCKIAMDIGAKHIQPDENGVRIAELDEMSYRRQMWNHTPITDFWRVGRGYEKKLRENGMYTMGDVALCSVQNEALLYKLFGVNAQLLIDHAWGWEPCTIADVKAYKPETNSMSSGHTLHSPYEFDKARLVMREMTDAFVLDLVDKQLVTNRVELTVGYDIENLTDPERQSRYIGKIDSDRYGRKVPKSAHGAKNLGRFTSSTELIMNAMTELFDEITDRNLLIRKLTVSAHNIIDEQAAENEEVGEQLDLFTDYAAKQKKMADEEQKLQKEKQMQKAVLSIKKRFGKNAILKGMNYKDGAVAKQRNEQVGGHKA